MNVNLYGCRGQWLMVDLGLTFADPDYPGIELILPDLEFIEKQQERLARHRPHPRPRGPYRRAALSRRGAEGAALRDAVHRRPDRREARGGGADRPGQAQHRRARREHRARAVQGRASSRLSHSIPEGNGLLIETPFGSVFHTGDWKIDDTPVLGEAPSTEVLTRIGDEGVLALVCDSTNVFQPEPSGSEESVHAGLRAQVDGGEGAGAGHHLRVQRRAAADDRQGRDRDRAHACASPAARSTGSCASPRRPAICAISRRRSRFDEAMRLPRERGADHRHRRAGRAARGARPDRLRQSRAQADRRRHGHLLVADHPRQRGRDRPDHEPAVGPRRQDRHRAAGPRPRLGPSRAGPSWSQMYEWVRPQIVVPVHGEARHLAEHARLALSHGVPSAVVQKNGDVIRLAPGEPRRRSTRSASAG